MGLVCESPESYEPAGGNMEVGAEKNSNEREKNSIETSQRVKHTGTNSTRNDLAS